MIKKTILMLLVLVGGVMTANADEPDIYLRSNIYSTTDNEYYGWDNDVDALKFTCEGTDPNNSNQVIYTKTISANNISSDINFRLHIATWDNTQLVPYQGQETVWTFSESNSVNYDINSWANDFKSDYWDGSSNPYKDSYFSIKHTTIKASEYKIYLYRVTNNNAENKGHIYMVVDIISMPATIGNSGYATFSCDRALNFEGTDIKAYVASSVSKSSSVVNMASVTKVPAGTGLFLKGATANIPVIETSQATAVSANLLCPGTGVSVASTSDTYRYVFQNQASGAGFYKLPTTGVTIPKGKAYLEISKDDAPQAPSFSIDLDGETTGIKVINFNEDNNQNNGQMFDLQGRRIVEPTKGVYIVNGKKVIIK